MVECHLAMLAAEVISISLFCHILQGSETLCFYTFQLNYTVQSIHAHVQQEVQREK